MFDVAVRPEVHARSDDALEVEFSRVHREWQALGARRLRLLAEIDRRRVWSRMGHVSPIAWLAERFRMGWSAARRDVEAAQALEEMPAAREAMAAGALSASALGVLVEARKVDPEAFASSEPTLVEAARELPVRALRNRVATWRHSVEDPVTASERRFESRRLDVGTTAEGMVRIEGLFEPETGQNVITAVRAVMDAGRLRGDRRTGPQRRADALGEVCRSFLDRRDRPKVGGERPVMSVMVDASVLTGGPGRAELADAGPVTAEAARRMACDASVVRMVMSAESEPLDVGRRTRVIPAGLRRAVEARDRHCRFPGCDRPPAWGEVHHVVHWADGGGTSKDNLVLMCWRHHRAVHEEGFRLRMVGGRPAFTAPDGTPLEERGPP